MASLANVRDAYLDQWSTTRRWCGQLDASGATRPSILPGWSVADLVAHLGLVADSLVAANRARSRERRLSLAEYLSTYADGAAAISDRTTSRGSVGWPQVLAEVDLLAASAHEALIDPDLAGAAVVLARRGPIRWSDFVTTRCIELAVHTDDLSRSVPKSEGPPLRAPCLKVAVRALTTVLAERAPGHSVEVRVPPYAAVQAVSGPRHTRGTPGAVIEMAPITMLRLATGREGWQDAMAGGSIQASGERADLSPWLPLLA